MSQAFLSSLPSPCLCLGCLPIWQHSATVLFQVAQLSFKIPYFRDLALCGPALVLWGRVLPCWSWCRFIPEGQLHQHAGAWSLVQSSHNGAYQLFCSKRQCHLSQMHSKKGEPSHLVCPRGSSDCTVSSLASTLLLYRSTAAPTELNTSQDTDF